MKEEVSMFSEWFLGVVCISLIADLQGIIV
jgi:hypothetical protein